MADWLQWSLFAVVVALVFLLVGVVGARPAPLPSNAWSPEAQLWLARCQVAEAGWDAQRDHDAIAWVLARRWEIYNAQLPPGTAPDSFARFVQRYSVPLQGRPVSRRQRWVRQLNFAGTEPSAWPSHYPWRLYRPKWEAVLQRAEAWAAGQVPDPSRGKALHWGGTMDFAPTDTPHYWWQPLRELKTKNTFYRIRTRERRAQQ